MLPLDIDVRTVKQMLDHGDKFMLLDRREHSEVASDRIAGTTHVPRRESQARIAELDAKEEPNIVHCHHGGRSQRVTQLLHQQGFDKVQNMAGGIDAWSQEIDSTIPRYE